MPATLAEFAKRAVYFQLQVGKTVLLYMEDATQFIFHDSRDNLVYLRGITARGDLVASKVGEGYADFDIAPDIKLTLWENLDKWKEISVERKA